MPDLMQYVWPFTVLVIFGGMLLVVMRALSIAHDLAKIVLQQGYPQPAPLPVPAPLPKPVPAPVPTPKPVPPAEPPVVDEGLVNFIKKTEAFSAKAYWDYKQYSIGYGTKANSANEVIDEEEATRRLTAEIANAEAFAERVIPAGAPRGVKQALTDLTYNAGSGWEEQTLGALIKAGKYEEAKSHVLQYNHAGGQVLAGLTARREAEVSWFDHPI